MSDLEVSLGAFLEGLQKEQTNRSEALNIDGFLKSQPPAECLDNRKAQS